MNNLTAFDILKFGYYKLLEQNASEEWKARLYEIAPLELRVHILEQELKTKTNLLEAISEHRDSN